LTSWVRLSSSLYFKVNNIILTQKYGLKEMMFQINPWVSYLLYVILRKFPRYAFSNVEMNIISHTSSRVYQKFFQSGN